jgi:Ca2+/H+ antiporter, TMEM165/GDT1 family
MEYVVVALTAFGLIAPVELPDKTFVATLVLSTRYRPLPVWLGVIAAFAVQCLVAVAAGHLLSRLPQRPVALVAAALFAIGAGVLLHGARRADAAEAEQEREYATKITDGRSGRRAAATSFAVLFTAEWGDLSQLLTAGLAANPPCRSSSAPGSRSSRCPGRPCCSADGCWATCGSRSCDTSRRRSARRWL